MTATAVASLLLAAALGVEPPAPPAPPAPPELPVPSPRQQAWHELGFTAFVHFGPNTFTGREWGHGDEPASVFNPTELDARQWVRAFKAAGAQGVVVTAKHHDGWCAWPTALSDHSVKASPWQGGKGDVLREVSQACRAEGLKFGVYLSPWDRNHPAYGSGDAYNAYFKGQLREVLTSYGEVFEVWFDGACGEGPDGRRQVYDWPGFIQLVRELQPGAVIFSDVGPDIRWVGNEEGHAGETCWGMLDTEGHGRGADNPPAQRSLHEGDEHGKHWVPAECDVSIRPGWFHRDSENERVKTPEQLLDLYERSAGRNANLHLNVPPDRRGLLHERDVATLEAFGALLRATYGPDSDVAASGVRTAGEGILALSTPAPVAFDRVLLREDLSTGQRIKAWVVEAQRDGAWVELARGTTMGIRRIVRVPITQASAVRVRVLDSHGTPRLERLSLHASPAMRAPIAGAARDATASGGAAPTAPTAPTGR